MKFVLQKCFDWMCALFVLTAPSSVAAQSAPVVTLPAANAVLREEFTTLSVHALRELKDGRVLITETGGASRLVVGDFKLLERV